jgi:hypothetical protein
VAVGTGRERRGERRRRAEARAAIRAERAAAMRRHPTGRPVAIDVTPPAYGRSMDQDTRTGTDDLMPATHRSRPGDAAQPGTPPREERAAQQPLPFDDAADDPIPYALTARARRAVAPHALPPLTVVADRRTTGVAPAGGASLPVGPAAGWRPTALTGRADPAIDDGAVDVPGDTRAARARALRRAGMGTAAIARTLEVDELVVRAWVGDPIASALPGVATDEAVAADDAARTALALVRAAAADEARALVRTDPGFAAGLGLLAGLVETDAHAVTLTTSRPEVAARAIGWLHERAGVEPATVRVVLRLGAGEAGDLARHRWAERLGVPIGQVAHTRWRAAPSPDAAEALVRVADPELAATIAGWCDGLLDPHGHDPADVAF